MQKESQRKTLDDIGRDWDRNVQARALELSTNSDAAYRSLCNHILKHLKEHAPVGSSVLDAGCGLGFLTKQIHDLKYNVVGVDVSHGSIRFAVDNFKGIDFEANSIEDYAVANSSKFHAVVANMVLHNTPDLGATLKAISKLLQPGGVLIGTIPHPAFYLYNRADLTAEQLGDYSEEHEVELPFRIRGGEPHPGLVSYYHRGLASYNKQLRRARLIDIAVDEPSRVGPGNPHDVLILVAHESDSD